MPRRAVLRSPTTQARLLRLGILLFLVANCRWVIAAERSFAVPASIREHLQDHCFACHGDGASEGGLGFDELESGEYGEETFAKWIAIWENVRAETMPPADADPFPLEHREALIDGIESDVFRLDPDRPDPGRVTIRRLNRIEYRHAISDILGVDYNTAEEFPADDTGYGFDTIGEVLNLSPVLFERYLAAADEITSRAIPLDGPSLPEVVFWRDHWRADEKGVDAKSLSFTERSEFRVKKNVPKAGRYVIQLEYGVDAIWAKRPETVTLVLRHDGETPVELGRKVVGWDSRKDMALHCEAELPTGEVILTLELIPGEAPRGDSGGEDGEQPYELRLENTRVTGPTDAERKYKYPADRIFFDGPPSDDSKQRLAYAREIISRVADRAFRRPIDEPTLAKLASLAEEEWSRPDSRFEHGIKAALSLVISSPRFLFRVEGLSAPDSGAAIEPLDEFELATRMAFFLWASPPDGGLHWKARENKLRAELDDIVDEMIDEEWRRERFVRSFVGQWLQLRDLHEIDTNVAAVLGYKHPERNLYERRRWHMRSAMQRETEMLFDHILVEDRPIEELLTARYTFANQWNAKAYGLKGVDGDKLKKVDLPADSKRRGILTHGSILLVTSNPTRTSPVKRGLFVLENLLGTPAPPAPADVPALEEVKDIDKRTASLRSILEAHRKSPECASCHQRMDPLGLALEHYDALGLYRDVERGRPAYKSYPAVPDKPIDPSGQLLSGEEFDSLDELIDILATTRKKDLYRCLTEKLMTYALGRGIEYYDAPAIDNIVEAVERDGGSMRTLIHEIVKSVPFQYRRGPAFETTSTHASR